MNKIAINSIAKELARAADFCRDEKIGIEIGEFAFPKCLDTELGSRIERT
jgi:hypothetical protein